MLLRAAMAVACCVIACANSSPPAAARFELEPYAPPPAHWLRGARVPAEHTLEMTFALRQRNVDTLEETLLRISDPQHEDYGEHLDLQQLSELLAPAPRTLAAVRGWLAAHGAELLEERTVGRGEFLTARLTLAVAERMLQTRYHHFELVTGAGGATAGAELTGVVRAAAPYTVPAHLKEHLDFVSPGHSFVGLGAQIKALGGRLGVGPHEGAREGASAGASAGFAQRLAGHGPPGGGGGAVLQRRLRAAVESDDDGDDGGSWGSDGDEKPSVFDKWVFDPSTVTPYVVRRWYGLGHVHSKDIMSGKPSASAFRCVGLSADGSLAGAGSRRLGQAKKGALVWGWGPVNFLREITDIKDSWSDYFRWIWPEGAPYFGGVGHIDIPAVRRMGVQRKGEEYGAATKANEVKGVTATGEATMDLQLGALTGAGANIVIWSTSGHSPDPYTTQSNHEPNEPWVKWMVQTGHEACAPTLFSISYADNEDSCTHKWAQRANIELMKMGARGISVFAASGDEGVGGAWHEDCKGSLLATWPAGSPYITAVGGTRRSVVKQGDWIDESHRTAAECKGDFKLFHSKMHRPTDVASEPQRPPPDCVQESEVGSSQSAGGFSYYFRRPKYQEHAVRHYLEANKARLPTTNNGKFGRRFNWRHGRAYPDVAAFSEGVAILMSDHVQPGDGTSASTPLTAGIFAMLNDLRKEAGKRPLGFVNPFIYQNPQGFRDIVRGSNPGCGIPGFQCAVGWDPVTGMGSPKYNELAEAVKKLK